MKACLVLVRWARESQPRRARAPASSLYTRAISAVREFAASDAITSKPCCFECSTAIAHVCQARCLDRALAINSTAPITRAPCSSCARRRSDVLCCDCCERTVLRSQERHARPSAPLFARKDTCCMTLSAR